MIGLYLGLAAPKLALAVVTLAVTGLLQAVVAPFAMPAWLIGLLPVINYGLNEAIIRLAPHMSGQDKRNLVRAVSITVVVGLLLFRAVSLPAPLPTTMLIEDWAPWALLLLGWIWAGAQVVHDAIDAAGKRTAKTTPP